MNTTGLVMTVTDELLAELETLAEWATEAPWEWDGRKVDSDGSVYIPECSYLVGAICLASDYEGYQHDCDYIAAAKPDTMKALTAELRRLRAENAELAKDSGRYRFARKLENDCFMLNTLQRVSGNELDTAIDTAMASK